ncbi:MAG: N-acetylmuramoyl-L-alanine amidase [Rhizobiales bacterium]|nr:N-acetylmuramoyl-L-alanine amidase [Hyphomicrobiales bacterium]
MVATASDARLGGDEHRTRFIVDLSSHVEFFAFTLADPYRVVIDMPQVAFRMPAKTGQAGRGLVKAFRYGLVMPGGSRIVIDAAGPVRIDKAFVLEPVDGQPARLVVDLVSVDRETFLRNLASQQKPPKPSSAHAQAAQDATDASNDMRPVVVIDPGHGGLDAGTTAPGGEMEKAIVLDFASLLKERLERTEKFRVVMTRSDDSFIPLGERVRIARNAKAALFISIHADAIARRDADTRGATVYTLSDRATDAEAARLADSENKADAIAGVDLSVEPDEIADILIDLAQRETKTFSGRFARTLVKELKSAARLHKRPMRSAGFKVLKAPDVPSVLLELGYVSSEHDLKLMMSDAWRNKVVDSMVQAVSTFFSTKVAGAGN